MIVGFGKACLIFCYRFFAILVNIVANLQITVMSQSGLSVISMLVFD